MIRIPTHRAPTHPGEMLLEEFLKPMGITQRELATAINVPTAHTTDLLVRVQATSQTGTGSIFAVRVFEDSTSI